MSLIEINKTSDVRIPVSSNYNFNHSHGVGSDGCLVVIIASPVVEVSSITYGGQSMTNIIQQNNSYSVYWSVWELISPPTGSNSLSVDLNSGNLNNVSTMCYSFTGCDGIGETSINNVASVGQNTDINISDKSMIIGSVISGNNSTGYIEIPQGVSRTLDWNHNITNYTFGGISPKLTPGGVRTIVGGSTFTNIIMAVEVLESESETIKRKVIIV